MSIQYYGLAKDEELPEEFCAIRHEHGEPSEYHWYIPEPKVETDETGFVTRVEIDGRWYVLERTTTRSGRFKTKYGRRVPLCEHCGYAIGDDRYNYCPKCGARIEVEK